MRIVRIGAYRCVQEICAAAHPVFWGHFFGYSKTAPIRKTEIYASAGFSRLFSSASTGFSLCFLIWLFPLSDPSALGIHLFSSH